MTFHGVQTVARQEITIRLRAGRWRWLLAAWFLVLLLVTLLLKLSIDNVNAGDAKNKGIVVYGGLTLFVLGLALLVVPTLAAQSVNGDRERGTLATLQVTRLSAGDIALGKFAAAWGVSLVFLAVTLPLVVFSMVLGDVPLTRVLAVTAVLALLLGTVISLALCLSAIMARTTTSGVLSYLAVGALTVGTLVAFGLGAALSQETYTGHFDCPTAADLTSQGVPAEQQSALLGSCADGSYQGTRTRTDRVWWLLAPNPFVVLADAAPSSRPRPRPSAGLARTQRRRAGRRATCATPTRSVASAAPSAASATSRTSRGSGSSRTTARPRRGPRRCGRGASASTCSSAPAPCGSRPGSCAPRAASWPEGNGSPDQPRAPPGR